MRPAEGASYLTTCSGLVLLLLPLGDLTQVEIEIVVVSAPLAVVATRHPRLLAVAVETTPHGRMIAATVTTTAVIVAAPEAQTTETAR